MGNREVLARAGEDPDKPEYVVSLYLESNYSQHNPNPMPYWFEELLQSKGGGYHTLAAAARVLDISTFTKVECYHCHHKR